jgi:hypothetical protein
MDENLAVGEGISRSQNIGSQSVEYLKYTSA